MEPTECVESQHWIQNGKFRDNICFGSELDECKVIDENPPLISLRMLFCKYYTSVKRTKEI